MRVAADIQQAEGDVDVTVVVDGLEVVEADYRPSALAPAIAGWAAQAFGFPPDDRMIEVTR